MSIKTITESPCLFSSPIRPEKSCFDSWWLSSVLLSPALCGINHSRATSIIPDVLAWGQQGWQELRLLQSSLILYYNAHLSSVTPKMLRGSRQSRKKVRKNQNLGGWVISESKYRGKSCRSTKYPKGREVYFQITLEDSCVMQIGDFFSY